MIVTTPARVGPGRVLALGGLSSFGPLALDVCLPGLPMMAADLRTSEAAAQLTLSTCMIGLALGQLVTGPLTDRVGRRRTLVLGVALFGVTAALCAVAPSIEVLLALRLLGGLGGGAGIVIARSMARDLYQGPALARVYARLMLVTGIAPVLAPLLAGQLLLVTDWRGVFAALAGIGLLLLVTALAQRETLPPHLRRDSGARETVRELRDLLRDRAFLPPTLVLGLGLCGMFTYIAMGSFVLQQVYGLDAQAFALVSAANAVAIVLFSQAGAMLGSRLGAAVLLSVGVRVAFAAATAMLVGVLVSDSVLALLVPLFVLVGCTGLIAPNATALALDRQGALAGSASALIGLAQFSVAAVVPPLASLGGVTPVVLAVTVVSTAGAAAVVHAVGLRNRTAPVTAVAQSVPGGHPFAFVPGSAPHSDAWGDDPAGSSGPGRPVDRAGDGELEPAAGRGWLQAVDPQSVRRPAGGPGQTGRRHRLQWVPVAEPDDGAAPSPSPFDPDPDPDPDPAADAVGPVDPAAATDPIGRGAQDDRDVLVLDERRRREWRRVAEMARRAGAAAEETTPLGAVESRARSTGFRSPHPDGG